MSAERQVKRLIIPAGKKEKLLIATTSHPERDTTVVFKALSQIHEHYTMMGKNDGTFDLHFTKEGTKGKGTKSHIPLAKGRIDLEKLRNQAEEFYKKTIKNPIQITDKSLSQYVFIIPKSFELWKEFSDRYYPVIGRKQVYPDQRTKKLMLKEFQHYFIVCYVDEIKEKFAIAFLLNESDESMKLLLNDNGNCLILDLDVLTSMLPSSFEIKTRFCHRCGTEVPLAKGWCPTCKKRIKKLLQNPVSD